MIKIKALQGESKEFHDILINPDQIVLVLPVFIKGDLVDNAGIPVGEERAMVIMSTGQQVVVDTIVEDFPIEV